MHKEYLLYVLQMPYMSPTRARMQSGKSNWLRPSWVLTGDVIQMSDLRVISPRWLQVDDFRGESPIREFSHRRDRRIKTWPTTSKCPHTTQSHHPGGLG
jgi:hypothetical protein